MKRAPVHADEVAGGRGVLAATCLDGTTAAFVAAMLQALATPSRLMILTTLRQRPHPVTELATAIGMEQSAVSHQLRLLRALGLITSRRNGRRIIYRLYDDHVAQLLDQAVHHIEHLRLGVRDLDSRSTARAGTPGACRR
ncbi:ArsR/SmtB family transcription factor [Streptomyces sp. x-19]|uniref:ArsR/SmtB family transcription factor n=1 Tax=Streptomyces sp. x-19 TaxID=2789280 RepID=UPI00397F18EC